MNNKINDLSKINIEKDVNNIKYSLTSNGSADILSYISLIVALISIILTFDFNNKIEKWIIIVILLVIAILIVLIVFKLYIIQLKKRFKITRYSKKDAIDCFNNEITNHVMVANELLNVKTSSDEEELYVISKISDYINDSIFKLNEISSRYIYSSNFEKAKYYNNIAIQKVEIIMMNITNVQKELKNKISKLEVKCSNEIKEILTEIKAENIRNEKQNKNVSYFDGILSNIKKTI